MKGAARTDEAVIAGRFRLEHLVKGGPGVQTWQGTDLRAGGAVAIKTLTPRTAPPFVRARLLHEANVLAGLHDPALPPLIEAGESRDSFFLAVPWITGQTLAERLRRGTLAVRDALGVGTSVLGALSVAHEAGVLHRDIKPSNVLLRDKAGGSLGAVLLDFGLARSVELEFSLRDQPVGTVGYLAPEQAGLLEREVDERSDLYSLGAVLYECLAGRPPFTGRTASEVLAQHLSATPPTLPAGVPDALNAVVQRLLQKEPRDRYQSAAGVRADLELIAEKLEHGIAQPAIVVGLHDRRQALAEPAFVGRAEELALFEQALKGAMDGIGKLVLLEAESGGGKTRLLDELEGRWRSEAWVLRGRALAQVASRPFEVLAGIAQGILSAVQADPALGPILAERVGPLRESICSAFPDLAEVFGSELSSASALGPETLGEGRTLSALVRLVQALGTPDRPAVILLDDCQWADEAALKLLQLLHQEQSQDSRRRRTHLLAVAAFRSDEVVEGHALRVMPDVARVRLPALRSAEVSALVESMAGALPEQAVGVVKDLSCGSPFMATAVLRGMVESGALVPEGGAFRVEPLGLDDVRSSGQAAVFLSRRLSRLPDEMRQLLSVGAVLGREFDVEPAALFAGVSVTNAMAAVREARRRGIVWTRSDDIRAVFVHDKLREGLLTGLSKSEREELHLRAAREMERTDPSRVFDIAYHFDAAGASERALPYALKAAALARSRHALGVAEQQFRIARRGANQAVRTDRATRLSIAEGLGDVLMLRGVYDESFRELEEAMRLTVNRVDRARLHGKISELAFKRGDMDAAGRHVEHGLRVLRQRVLVNRWAVLLGLLWEVWIQVLHSLSPRLFLARRRAAGHEVEFLAIHLYSRLAHVSWFQRGNAATAWAHLREMNLAERYPPTEALAQAYSEHAPVMTMVPWFSRGRDYARRSYEIRKSLGDVWGQGQSLHFLGVVLYAASRFDECVESCRQALHLLERTGDRWEINTAQWHIAYCHYRLGRLSDAVSAAKLVYQAGVEIGDAQARGINLAIWAKAAPGGVPAPLLAAELARSHQDVHTRAELLQGDALRLLARRQLVEASDALEEADRLVQRAGMKQEYVVPIRPWLATALRLRAESESPHAPDRRRALIRRGLRASRRAVARARSYRNNLPHALRERGYFMAMAGRPRRARRLFDESLRCAWRLRMRQEVALTRSARGTVGAVHHWRGAAEDARFGETELETLVAEIEPRPAGPKLTISLADRFHQLLAAGRHVASALTERDVYDAVRHHATVLLRPDRCLILRLQGSGGDAIPIPESLADHGPFSREVIRRAMHAGRPVTLTEQEIAPDESAVLTGARSVLCAPIRARGSLVALLYATHSRIEDLFGEVEERMAQFIVTLAGTALENAEGFASIQSLAEERHQLYLQSQEAVRARDEFISIAAHELRTPLTSLGIQLAVLQRSARGETRRLRRDELAERLDRLTKPLHRFDHLIARLVDVARTVGGELVVEAEDADMVKLVRDSLDHLEELAWNSRSVLRLHAPDHLDGRWDTLRVEQVVTNLVTNALKFGAGQPVDVEVSGDTTTVSLTVRDRGIGIAPEDQRRIFDRFERAVSMRHYGGLGLGLWITRQFVTAMGGRVHVESSRGHGASFYVDLPRTMRGGQQDLGKEVG